MHTDTNVCTETHVLTDTGTHRHKSVHIDTNVYTQTHTHAGICTQ